MDFFRGLRNGLAIALPIWLLLVLLAWTLVGGHDESEHYREHQEMLKELPK